MDSVKVAADAVDTKELVVAAVPNEDVTRFWPDRDVIGDGYEYLPNVAPFMRDRLDPPERVP
jgi:hypothetical protein